jgi:hypothetical protein
VTAGYLSDRWDGLAPALTLLSIGPLVMAGLVVAFYPETARLELEELNPEDPRPPDELGDLAEPDATGSSATGATGPTS